MNNKIDVSVIIRTYNEEEKIRQCLDSISNQEIKEDFEIIIVDSESADKTLEIAGEFNTNIIKIPKKRFTYGKSLNLGISNSSGKYVVMISAHAVPTNRFWLANIISGLKQKNIAGIYGKQVPFPEARIPEERAILNLFRDKKNTYSDNPFFHNANAAIRRDLWEEYRFNEQMKSAEDHDWIHYFQKKGYKSLYDPKASVYHSHNESLIQIFKRTRREVELNRQKNNDAKTENIKILKFRYRMFKFELNKDWQYIKKHNIYKNKIISCFFYRIFWISGKIISDFKFGNPNEIK